jgi:hypothetical protein
LVFQHVVGLDFHPLKKELLISLYSFGPIFGKVVKDMLRAEKGLYPIDSAIQRTRRPSIFARVFSKLSPYWIEVNVEADTQRIKRIETDCLPIGPAEKMPLPLVFAILSPGESGKELPHSIGQIVFALVHLNMNMIWHADKREDFQMIGFSDSLHSSQKLQIVIVLVKKKIRSGRPLGKMTYNPGSVKLHPGSKEPL